jgi:hypothetical protein
VSREDLLLLKRQAAVCVSLEGGQVVWRRAAAAVCVARKGTVDPVHTVKACWVNKGRMSTHS